METPYEQLAGHKAPPSAEAARQLHTEQLSLLYRQAAPGLLASVIVALFTAFILQDQVPRQNIAIWLGVAIPVYGARFALIRRYRERLCTETQRRRAARLMPVGTLATGLIWGWGTLFLYPDDSVIHQVFLVLVTAGLSSGTTVTYSALRWASAGFIAPAMIPLGIKFLTVNDPVYLSMGLIILIYAGVLLVAQHNAYQVIRNGILTGIEKAALAEDLQREVEERKLTEQSLLASRKRLTDAQRIAGFGNWEWYSTDDRIVWSDETCRIFGLEPGQAPLTHGGYIERLHPEDRDAVAGALREALRLQAAFGMDYRIVRPGGAVRHVHDEGQVRYEGGVAVGMAGVVQDITRRVEAEERIKRSEREFSRILDNIQDIYYRTDLEGVLTRVSPSVGALLGYAREECLGRPLSRLLAQPEQESRMRESIGNGGGAVTNFEARMRRSDGSGMWFSFNAQYVRNDAGEIVAYEGVARDITQIKRAEEALFQEKERALVTLQSIGDGVITTDRDGMVDYVNPIAERLLEQPADALYGRNYVDVLHLVDDAEGEPLNDLVQLCLTHEEGVVHADDRIIRHRNGTEYSIKISAAAMRDSTGELIGAVLVLHDMTELARMARQLSYQASHDTLTGLVNRREFENRVERALAEAQAENSNHVLFYLDLDQFKLVNDTCGHRAGDQLLEQLAGLMSKRIRASDTLARLGGDEFGVLLENCPMEKAAEIAEDIRRTLREFRFVWENKVFDVGVSIGVVPVNADSGGLIDVLSQADAACYVAKDQGRNRVHLYTPGDNAVGRHHGEMEWVHRIYSAFDEERFVLYAQPVVGLGEKGRTSHYEILMRMEGGNGELIAPDAFIPAAERYNLMPTLDRWVIRTTLGVLRQAQGPAPEPPVRCAINLSGQSLCDDHFLDFVVDQLDFTGVPGEAICFEITETAAIANLTRAMRFISILKGMGCTFALDDFGTGLSSFGYLKNLSVNYLKIDGSFVRNMVTDPVDRAMVNSINQMGHVMGLTTIAEFAESREIIDELRSLEVDMGQGYELGRPAPFAAILKECASIANVMPISKNRSVRGEI